MSPTLKLQVFTVTVDGEKHEIEARNGWAAVAAAQRRYPKAKKVTAILKGAFK